MDNATFATLTSRARLAYVLGLASRLFGREQVLRYYRQIAPLAADRVGHGDVADPSQNYWGGVWQVYRAD